MGVDAGIFAKNAKKYFWFDRAHNLQGWWHSDNFWDRYPGECDRAERIHDSMYKPDSWNAHVSAQDVIFLAELSKNAWLECEGRDQSRSIWCDLVINFVKKFPNDVFSMKSDSGGEWLECCDEYDEVKEVELNEQ